jgi:hypothetical protein
MKHATQKIARCLESALARKLRKCGFFVIHLPMANSPLDLLAFNRAGNIVGLDVKYCRSDLAKHLGVSGIMSRSRRSEKLNDFISELAKRNIYITPYMAILNRTPSCHKNRIEKLLESMIFCPFTPNGPMKIAPNRNLYLTFDEFINREAI